MLGIRLYWLIIVSKRVNLGYVNRIVFDLSLGHKLFKQRGYDLCKDDDYLMIFYLSLLQRNKFFN